MRTTLICKTKKYLSAIGGCPTAVISREGRSTQASAGPGPPHSIFREIGGRRSDGPEKFGQYPHRSIHCSLSLSLHPSLPLPLSLSLSPPLNPICEICTLMALSFEWRMALAEPTQARLSLRLSSQRESLWSRFEIWVMVINTIWLLGARGFQSWESMYRPHLASGPRGHMNSHNPLCWASIFNNYSRSNF